jgi:hypothetical protein
VALYALAGGLNEWRETKCFVLRAELVEDKDRKCSGTGTSRKCRQFDIYRFIFEVAVMGGEQMMSIAGWLDFGAWVQDRPTMPRLAINATVACLVPRNKDVVSFADLITNESNNANENRRVAQLDRTLDDLRRADTARSVAVYVMIPGFTVFIVFFTLTIIVRRRGDFDLPRTEPVLPYGVALAHPSGTSLAPTVPPSWQPVGIVAVRTSETAPAV